MTQFKKQQFGIRPLQEVLDERFGGIEYLNTLFKKALIEAVEKYLEDFDDSESEAKIKERLKFEFKDGDTIWNAPASLMRPSFSTHSSAPTARG